MTDTPDRFVLGIAYQAGPDPLIKRGADGGLDYFTKRELELASRTYMRKNAQKAGLFHIDGTEDAQHAELVESYIYRNPEPWILADGRVVKNGDWLTGYIVDEPTWDSIVEGKITGLSPQGTANRRRIKGNDK
jgi:hypothetical protein